MDRRVCFFVAAALVVPQMASAQMLPHRAEYELRLGPAANAPRIGKAIQDITLDCTGWHIRRDISSEIAITSSWKMSIASKLDGQESRGGNGFDYRTVQIQNGSERETKGHVQRTGKETRADILWPNGPQQLLLPPPNLMPVSALHHLVDRLKAKAVSFPALMFDAEVIGDAFLVDVEEIDPATLRKSPPADTPVKAPGESWPVSMAFTRGRQQDQKPLFSVTAKVYDSGVLDRLTVDTGLVTIAADLKSLEMHKAPTCPGS
ncbi:MAG: DUF1849 family protein [Alphaproteobacteria bacterium]|nr:DUF1849 family protein [Alphaproteobacteria bacterium]